VDGAQAAQAASHGRDAVPAACCGGGGGGGGHSWRSRWTFTSGGSSPIPLLVTAGTAAPRPHTSVPAPPSPCTNPFSAPTFHTSSTPAAEQDMEAKVYNYDAELAAMGVDFKAWLRKPGK